jgi:hypothetical protein
MALNISIKHIQVNKANNHLAIIVAAAVVVSVFCLVSTKSLLSQANYQRKVISAKHKAADQLKTNVVAANQLINQYKVFKDENPNIVGGIGGTNPGDGPLDGDNARIVLDALPSQYDFPALISSLEKVLGADSVSIQGVSGTDLGQPTDSTTGTSTPIDMTFSIDVISSYGGVQKVIADFERSIRPIDINTLELSGTQDTMHVTINATTYYQPATTLSVTEKEVR